MLVQPFVILHLLPPDILTFERSFSDFSKIITSASGWFSLATIAEKKPAAPPPMIAFLRKEVSDLTLRNHL
jgi:hypothetical protein